MSKVHLARSGFITKAALPSITRQRGTTTSTSNLMLFGAGKTTVANNTTFIDSSANAFTVTRNGDTVHSGHNPFSTVSDGSAYFDGTGDYLTAPASSAFNFSTGDFTIEAWIYITADSSINGSGVRDACIFNVGSTAFTTSCTLIVAGNSTTTGTALQLYKNTNTETSIVATTTITKNAWHHVAATKSGTSIYLFLDGVQIGTTATSSTIWGSTTESVLVGRLWSSTTYLDEFAGYISNLRVVKGTAVYTSNFTPSTSALTAITNTQLLLLTDNYSIVNSTPTSLPVTIAGNTTISTAQYPTGMTKSIYFDGNGDFVQTPTSSSLAANSTNYTIEAWVYADMAVYSPADLGGRGIVSDYLANANGRWLISLNYTGYLTFSEQNSIGGGDVTITDSVAFPLTQWVHVMAVKSGTTMYLFKNGTLVNTATSASRTAFQGRLNIGQFTVDASYRGYFLGYISNVRFVVGTALYTSSFTPSSLPLSINISVPNYVTNAIYGVNQLA